MATIEALYKDFGVLADAKDKAGEHEQEYTNIMNAVHGGPNEKRLASQFIARFFKHFPGLSEKAINTLMDLCEDDDAMTRKQAIKDLPALCKDNKENVLRVADVLVQLLVSEDSVEQTLVKTSLTSCFKVDAKGALGGLFTQITTGAEDIREVAILFMSTKMKTLPEELFTKEVEDYLVEECKKVLLDVTGDEFVALMKILTGLKTTSTVQGRQQLVEIVTEQADLDKEFEAADSDAVDRLMQCTKQALPFFSKNVHSNAFVGYMCDRVLPVMSQITSEEGQDVRLDLIKLFADMSTYCGDDMENIESKLEKVYSKLTEYMPLPPPEIDQSDSKADQPELQFSYVECLMYAFHQIARKHPGFLADESNADRLKDFRLRLQFFARGLQIYIKQLRLDLQGKKGDELKTEESKIKVVALKTTSNINTLIKDLFHNPPAYKSTLNLSWMPPGRPVGSSPSAGSKRPGITPISFGANGAAKKPANRGEERSMYAPPTGKFSDKAGTYAENGRGRGGRGRGSRGGYTRRW